MEARGRVSGQFLAVTVLDDVAILQNEDLTGAVQGAQTVGDDDGSAVEEQLVDGAFNELFGGGVEARGGFVKNDQAGGRAGRCA